MAESKNHGYVNLVQLRKNLADIGEVAPDSWKRDQVQVRIMELKKEKGIEETTSRRGNRSSTPLQEFHVVMW